jgi:hypothetical protein
MAEPSFDTDRSLNELESIIERGRPRVRIFLEVGWALVEIHDRRLYREQYKTWDAYCRGRWGFGRDYGYKLMSAARVVLSDPDVYHGIQNERQARALMQPPDEFPEYDENIPVDHQCPRCGYIWSGSSHPKNITGRAMGPLVDDRK